nr:MOSC domain-containing protein [Streptomyces sp. MBT84]
MGIVESVNIGSSRVTAHSVAGRTGIDKRPVSHPVAVSAPGPQGVSGMAGDSVCDARFHGGDHQAVYDYAREDLDLWERELGRELSAGVFGENLTTRGLDVSGTVIGERWRVGDVVVLEASATRIPCRTFADRLGQESWIKRFGRRALPGVYFRVVVPGHVAAGAPVTLLSRPDHGVTSAMVLRALTGERELLPRPLEADAPSPSQSESARKRLALPVRA